MLRIFNIIFIIFIKHWNSEVSTGGRHLQIHMRCLNKRRRGRTERGHFVFVNVPSYVKSTFTSLPYKKRVEKWTKIKPLTPTFIRQNSKLLPLHTCLLCVRGIAPSSRPIRAKILKHAVPLLSTMYRSYIRNIKSLIS